MNRRAFFSFLSAAPLGIPLSVAALASPFIADDTNLQIVRRDLIEAINSFLDRDFVEHPERYVHVPGRPIHHPIWVHFRATHGNSIDLRKLFDNVARET
jgi:hypothetical protein